MQWVCSVSIGRRQMSAKQAKELADKWLDEYLRGRRSELRAADLQRQLELQRVQRERASRAAIDSRPKTETELVRLPNPNPLSDPVPVPLRSSASVPVPVPLFDSKLILKYAHLFSL